MPDGISIDGELRQETVPSAAKFDPDPDPVFRLLMGGLTPTTGQSAFFRRFCNAREDTWRKLYEQNRSMLATAGGDVLLTGMDGAGRTEALLAAALYAALVRGENVLFVVSSHDRALALAKVVGKRVSMMLLDDYVHVSVLSRTAMSAMMRGTGVQALPDVLFATLEQVERCFFGDGNSAGTDAREAVKAVILAYGTVFVDDFCGYPMEMRVHLPFILDKWRLVLSNGFILPQFVVAVPPVYRSEGLQALGQRLFGMGYAVEELHPRSTEPFWYGVIRIGAELDPDSAIADIVRLSHAEGVKIVYYAEGISKREKETILNGMAPGRRWPKLVSCLDEMDESDAEADAMLHLATSSDNAAPSMRLRVGDTSAVFLRIVLDAEEAVAPVAEPLVPLPDETALPLRVHHLQSILRFLPCGVPVDAAIWSRFGISMTSPTLRSGCLVGKDSLPARWFYDSWTEANYPRVPPYLVLEQASGDAAPGTFVGTGVLSAPPEVLWRVDSGGGAMRLLLARPEGEEVASRSLVEWRVGSNPVGESDLAHAERLECRMDGDTFVFDSRRDPEPGNARHACVVDGKSSRGARLDFVFPERSMSWNPVAGGKPFKCTIPSRVGNIASFRLEDEEQSTLRVDCKVTGRVNSFGRREDSEPLEYSYAAYVSGIVLAPNFSPSNEEETEQRLGPLAEAPVSTNASNYSSVLTHAFTSALKSMFDGEAFYAVTPVFWVDGGTGAAGKAVVWFVEPVDSGWSLFPLFKRMQGNPAFLKRFFSLVKECVGKADSVDRMRAMSRFAVLGDAVSADDRSRAQRLVELLLAENEEVDKLETTRRRGDGPPPGKKPADGYTSQEREFDRVVVDALLDFRPEIDVTKFAAEYGWDHDRISYLFFDVLWNNPQIFYVTKRASCRWTHCGDIVTRFVITDIRYGISKDEYPSRKAQLDKAVAEAMECVSGVDDPVEKARLLHDQIVRICEYDTIAADTNDLSAKARTAFSVLVRHLAVCEGYTMAYRYLLDRAGIRSEEVVSDAMNHSWNYVLLGDNWYHVDVTWDDPVCQGGKPSDERISHKHFLLSDAAIREKGHHDWDVRDLSPATDTAYDKRDWDSVPDSREKGKGVPWQKYRDHPLLRAKGSGNVKHCRGKIHLRVFFVDDGKCSWTDKTRKAYHAMVDDAIQTLERESGLGPELTISWSAENLKMSGSFSKGNDSHDAVPALLGVSGKADVAKLQNSFRKSHGYEEVPMLFVWARDFRGSAKQSQLELSARRTGEWATIGVHDILGNRDGEKRTFIHELLHLFGAEDFYYPPVVEKAADKWLPDSIMNEGHTIDALTRVLVGWDTWLSGNAEGFLNDTKGVTEKELDEACAAEWKKKWH